MTAKRVQSNSLIVVLYRKAKGSIISSRLLGNSAAG
jgi:hypothetical protein